MIELIVNLAPSLSIVKTKK